MKLHILGICGTFMGGIAAIARDQGHQVSGSDRNIYPPMSDQLADMGISLSGGYDAESTDPDVDLYIVGNVMRRGMPVIEALLRSDASYISGPQWLGEQVLRHKKVHAVAGTHGKTTTSSMLAWILQHSGQQPGFLIGGVSPHFSRAARLSDSPHFVIEADEYDSAFFDKRSKFVHYHADTLVLNNLEFDHADIFPDLEAIKTQFHHAVRTVPDNGLIIYNRDDANLQQLLEMGVWTPTQSFGTHPQADYRIHSAADGQDFSLLHHDKVCVEIHWSLAGAHNQFNATAAMLAARNAGVSLQQSAAALAEFRNVKRRQEKVGTASGVTVYDDFAHHPTAIAATLQAFRQKYPAARLVVLVEARSNSMRAGAHAHALPQALEGADMACVVAQSSVPWPQPVREAFEQQSVQLYTETAEMLQQLGPQLHSGDVVVCMSNGSFEGAPRQLLELLNG